MKIDNLDEITVEDESRSLCMIIWIDDDGVVFTRDCNMYNEGKLVEIDISIATIFKNMTKIDLEDYGVEII